MKHVASRSALIHVVVAMLLCALSGKVSAEIIDDISLKTDTNGELDVAIKFIVPVQYLRHSPKDKSTNLVINFNLFGNLPRNEWFNYETHRTPNSDLIQSLTVSTRDLLAGPQIQIQFIRPAEFKITAGNDGQSILIHVKPSVTQAKKEDVLPLVTVSSAVLPAVLPVVAGVPLVVPNLGNEKTSIAPLNPPTSVVTKSAALTPAMTVAAPAPSPAVTVNPVITPAPVTIPAPMLPPVVAVATLAKPLVNPVPVVETTASPKLSVVPSTAPPQVTSIQSAAKEGLPVFPEIQPVDLSEANTPVTEATTLAERSKIADSQAATLMAKGRDKMLAGEMFAAVEIFNSALNIPPNTYSADAQLWIAISREKAGQLAKAKSEYDTYLKLYPNGKDAKWIKARLAKLQAIQPFQPTASQQTGGSAQGQGNEFQTTQYGSVSSYYYYGNSQTDTVATIAGVDTASRLTATDQSSLINNISVTARAYNNEFDNRLVFQDVESLNFLKGQKNQNRLNAAYFEVKNRVQNYSARIGRQSALGGGVLGRFDGVSGGYGFSPEWRVNVVAGRLSDSTADAKPVFSGASLDFGMRSRIGGSVYAITQKIESITDRKAVGGNLRYFEQGKSAMVMVDYDIQFKELNMLTVQGTLNHESGTDFNFMIDHRKSPSLSITSAVTGASHVWGVQNPGTGQPFVDPVTLLPIPATFTTYAASSTVKELLANGWTLNDLIALAKKRTAISNVMQVGVTQRVDDKWQIGTDVVVSNVSSIPESGTLNPDGTTGLEGYVAATRSTGNTWTVSERLSTSDLIAERDITMGSFSFTKSQYTTSEMLMFYNHAFLQDEWTLDSSLRLSWQKDTSGGKVRTTAPVLKAGYRMKSSLTLEVETGVDWTSVTPSQWAPSRSTRKYLSLGFRWDF